MRCDESEYMQQSGQTTVMALACTGKDHVKLLVAFAATDVGARRIVCGRYRATEKRHSSSAAF